jgi:hypothetical protein
MDPRLLRRLSPPCDHHRSPLCLLLRCRLFAIRMDQRSLQHLILPLHIQKISDPLFSRLNTHLIDDMVNQRVFLPHSRSVSLDSDYTMQILTAWTGSWCLSSLPSLWSPIHTPTKPFCSYSLLLTRSTKHPLPLCRRPYGPPQHSITYTWHVCLHQTWPSNYKFPHLLQTTHPTTTQRSSRNSRRYVNYESGFQK